ncbi:MAG: hypothetical protein SV760_00325, partial [Halobacteria archaeon]|nr:hypothetical protein [Halobacteria archaeon]
MSSKEASADVDALGTLTDRVAARVSFKLYLGLTLVSTYVLMLLGAYTKAIGAGLSCPDWP